MDLKDSGARVLEFWRDFLGVWQFELLSIDNQPITVGKIAVAILLFWLGYFLSRGISRQLGERILPRLRVAEGTAAALQSLVFYVLLLFFALLALRLVNVPLTIFTVLGGAVAIGVGFGSQNIVNNFISGLILLIEQPIRVGDLIEVGELMGTVRRIGLRSTVVRTGSNIDIIVPNSSFLEKEVVNWTLGDKRVRTHIVVGVNYGSPTDRVKELLLKAAAGHERVLKSPKPFVWFTDFGDNALVFEVHFWCQLRSVSDKLQIQSDLRFSIDELFREADLVMAFPQRDVHLDVKDTVKVHIAK